MICASDVNILFYIVFFFLIFEPFFSLENREKCKKESTNKSLILNDSTSGSVEKLCQRYTFRRCPGISFT